MADKSRDLSQAEKKITVVKAKQIHKMTINFTQKGQKLSFLILRTVIFFLAWDKSRDLSANSAKLEQMVWGYIYYTNVIKVLKR